MLHQLTASSVESEIGFIQPELTISEEASFIRLSGSFVVSDGSGRISASGPLTQFDVDIWLPKNFPKKEPIVFETGGRIPRILDRHIYPKTGNCCITIWETWLINTTNAGIGEYISGPVNNYFFGQHYFEEYSKWPFGDWDHGLGGIVDAYAELIGCPPDEKIIERYLHILKLDWPKGHLPCPCGSGKKIRNCHRDEIGVIHQRIHPWIATEMLRTIEALTR